MEPIFFAAPEDFRLWLEKHHTTETELLVGFFKKGTGRPSITWPESVDQALCFGWIDGVRRTIDAESYSIRFTPRKTRSTWSAVNIAKVAELTELGLMHPRASAPSSGAPRRTPSSTPTSGARTPP
ncbi:YdeI family protein [Streptosporangium lutulentum]